MAELEQVVGQLERGDVPLEESIALYEQGAALKAHCEDKLKEAEEKVAQIRGCRGPGGRDRRRSKASEMFVTALARGCGAGSRRGLDGGAGGLAPTSRVVDAMRYAVQGGKRLRGFLVLEGARLHGVAPERGGAGRGGGRGDACLQPGP